MAPHDHSLRGWAGGTYSPVGGSQGVESPQQSGVRIARAASESRGVPSARSLPTNGPMLQLLLLLAAGGAEGVWPPIGLRQLVDSGEHRGSGAPVPSPA